jgi:Na+/H+ antiporter NhaC
MNKKNTQGNALAMIPFVVFIVIFLGTGIILSKMGYPKPFAQFPASVGAYIALMSAFLIGKGSLQDKFNTVIHGIKPNIIVVVFILALAGAFASLTKTIGGVDSIVGLCMTYLPINYITAGVFIVGCIISFASGTSIGTITALAPVALSVAAAANIPIALMAASILGSACFGNGLSLISDCTIASTGVMGVASGSAQKDKLVVHLMYAIPSVIVTVILLLIFGRPSHIVELASYSFNIVLVLPYILVVVIALLGINVMVALTSGILLSSIIGVVSGAFNVLEVSQAIASGMFGMANMILLMMFIAGMVAIVEKEGGLVWMVQKLKTMITGKRSAELVTLLLSVLATFCVGHDTISIVSIGEIAKDISDEYKLDPRKMACFIQSGSAATAVLIPYTGVNITMWAFVASAGLSTGYAEGVPYTFYAFLLLILTVVSSVVPFAESYLAKRPWNFEYGCPESEVAEYLAEQSS